MFFRILKKDLKRKKTMNIILLLFIFLATMFVASGVNNVVTVMNGTDYYLDQAGIGDLTLITMGDDAIGSLDEMLKTETVIDAYHMENVVYGGQDNIRYEDGKKLKTKNTVIFQSIDESVIHFFDSKNEEVHSVEPGHAYASGDFLKTNDLKVGDTILIQHGDVDMKLILDGKVKDALLGSAFMGNTRLIVNQKEIDALREDANIKEHYQGQICYIDTKDAAALEPVYGKIPTVALPAGRSMIQMCYVMDMILAWITLILSICLIIVSFVVLKFSITMTIAEEFREIGVMKAIGIKNFKIRSLYIGKYLMLSMVGAALGFVASIPFGKLLMQSVSDNMMLGNDSGEMINLLGAVFVVLVILGFAYLCTGKVKKSSPVDAIRSGQTGERYKKKTVYRLGKSHVSTNLYLAINDIISRPRQFTTILGSFFLCSLFVLILVNTTSTMRSDRLIDTFGTHTDLYLTDVSDNMEWMSGVTKKEFEEHLKDREKELSEQGMPGKYKVECQYSYNLTFAGKDHAVCLQQGVGTKSTEYKMSEGSVPQNKREIALTSVMAEKIGATIGDHVTIDYVTEKIDCVVVGIFESMNKLGEIIRVHEDAPTEFTNISGMMSYQIDFTDHPSPEEIEKRKEKLKSYYHVDEIMNAEEYCVDCIGVVDTMEAVQYLLLGITIVVVILVTILMERSFIADEKSQIAILKAIGFKNRDVVRWQVLRFSLVGLIAVILAAVVSIPVTDLCISPIFGMMGTSDIDYRIVPWKIFGMYPGIIFGVTVFVSWITALYTRTIKSSDTANIE